ncbi:membrane protein [Spirochaetia bacterium]|nr:membrane protein [Spirochaetia bacterium]
MKRPIYLFVLWFLIALPVFSQNTDSAENRGRGDYLTIKIAVMGPGDELYFWWGHIALVIEDAATGTSLFYDYGLFSFESDHFFRNFILGRLLFSVGASPAEASYRVYRRTNRDVTLYTLDLPASTREEIRRFAEINALPENRDYWYHHFKNNCVSPIRDIIDTATGGQFKAEFGEAPGRYTLRQHVRRHTWFNPFFDWFLNFMMGQDIDTPITVWDEMFLPQELGDRISGFTYTDKYGRERPLVSSVEVLNRAVDRPLVLDVPRKQWPRSLALGVATAILLCGVYALRRRKPVPGRVILGSFQALLGLFFGAVGLGLFFMTFFTNHDYTYHNINVLFINPLLFLAAPWGIMMARGRTTKRRSPEWYLQVLWTGVFFGCFLSMVIKVLPAFYQQNQVTQAMILPVTLVLSRIPHWFYPLLKRRGPIQGERT